MSGQPPDADGAGALPPSPGPPSPPAPARPPPLPPRRPAAPDGRETEEGALAGTAAPDTYVPVLPGRRVRWWALLLGLALTALGLWLVLGIVPDTKRKFEAAEAEGSLERDDGPFRYRSRRFRTIFDDDANEPRYVVDGDSIGRSDIEAMEVGAWFILVSGAAVSLLLGSRRPGRIRFCDVCGRDVLVVPRRGWRCERCNTKI